MFFLKNKISFLILIMSLSFALLGCDVNKDFDDTYKITPENIFNQSESQYYVYFYKDSCPYCEDVYDNVLNYIKHTNNDIKLYVCDLSDKKQITYELNFGNCIYEISVIEKTIISSDGAIQCIKNGDTYNIEYPNNIQLKVSWKKNKIIFKSEDLKEYVMLKEEVITNEIKRAYEGADGQGSSGKYYVNGISNYNDLYIAGVPSLILVTEDRTSTFVTSGRKNIKEYFNND